MPLSSGIGRVKCCQHGWEHFFFLSYLRNAAKKHKELHKLLRIAPLLARRRMITWAGSVTAPQAIAGSSANLALIIERVFRPSQYALTLLPPTNAVRWLAEISASNYAAGSNYYDEVWHILVTVGAKNLISKQHKLFSSPVINTLMAICFKIGTRMLAL